jgi:hypothetical protein
LGASAGGWLVPAAGARWGLGVVAGLHLVAALAGYLAGRSRVSPMAELADVEVMPQAT